MSRGLGNGVRATNDMMRRVNMPDYYLETVEGLSIVKSAAPQFSVISIQPSLIQFDRYHFS